MKNKFQNSLRKWKGIDTIIVLLIIFVVAMYFGIHGIYSNYSFWSDEAFTGLISKEINHTKVLSSSKMYLSSYQKTQIISNTLFFKIFGFSEWAARLPSVIWGGVGIIFAFLLANKYSNKYGGLLAAFIYSIFQLNLAYSTQARPYTAIETIFLIVVYLCSSLVEKPGKVSSHLTIIFFSLLAFLYNPVGAICFIPYLFVLLPLLYQKKATRNYFWGTIIFLIISSVLFSKYSPYSFKLIIPKYNWLTLSRDLFWRQYGLYVLPAIAGLFTIKDRKIKYGIGASTISLLYAWNFIQYSHNIRYLMPLFGLIIVLFGVFWANVGEKLFSKPALTCLAVALLIYAGGYKIVRKPAAYYTPNADFTSDVQNADYKTFFRKVYALYPDFDTLPVFVGPFDTLAWYTDRTPTALFSIRTPEPKYVDFLNAWQYGTLADFKREQAKYKKGLVIVNDWQSFMPDDIKDYVKKNMKREIRVESLEVSPYDKWPLELYSWGMEGKSK